MPFSLSVCGVSVFWDVQGCPTDLSVILQALRNKGYRGMVVLIPYLDMDYQGDELFTYDGYACVPSIKVQGEWWVSSVPCSPVLLWYMYNLYFFFQGINTQKLLGCCWIYFSGQWTMMIMHEIWCLSHNLQKTSTFLFKPWNADFSMLSLNPPMRSPLTTASSRFVKAHHTLTPRPP